jgi:uncharacterized membrane protein
MRVRRPKREQLSTLLALIVPVVLAVACLVVDLGRIYVFKAELQSRANAAAKSAAHEAREERRSNAAEAPADAATPIAYERSATGVSPAQDPSVRVRVAAGQRKGERTFVEAVARGRAPLSLALVDPASSPVLEARAVAVPSSRTVRSN